MILLGDILKDRIAYAQQNPELINQFYKNQSKTDKIKYNDAIEAFRVRLNVDLRRENRKELPFMGVRMKMYALSNIEDLRWVWRECTRYSKTRDKFGNKNTFKKAWFGMFKSSPSIPL